MFQVSAKGEYAALAVLALSLHTEDHPLQVKAISQRENIPLRFLEQVMSLLKKGGLVESVRGPHGGYHLTRAPAQISLGEVLQVIEGPQNPGDSSKARNGHPESIVLKALWSEIKAELTDRLNAVSFESLCKLKEAQEAKKVLMFHI